MKARVGIQAATIRIAALLLSLTAAAVHAQTNYSINWFRIGGGGGTSSNGQYCVSGAIGQPEAGPAMTHGGYSLTGGFWAICAVQTPGAPRLTIRLVDSTTAAISWESPWSGFVLQQNNSLSTTNWTNVGTAPTDDGDNKTVTVTLPGGNLFYRLQKE